MGSPHDANALQESLSAEQKAMKRAQYTINAEGNTTIVEFTAADPSSLRVAVNSVTKLLITFEKLRSV